MSQMGFFFAVPTSTRPKRRTLWRAEVDRLARLVADQRHRDAHRHAESLARLVGQLDDVRHRLADLERGVGIADLNRAPTRSQPRTFARP